MLEARRMGVETQEDRCESSPIFGRHIFIVPLGNKTMPKGRRGHVYGCLYCKKSKFQESHSVRLFPRPSRGEGVIFGRT